MGKPNQFLSGVTVALTCLTLTGCFGGGGYVKKDSINKVRNIGVGASCAKRADLEVCNFLGKDKLMWGSDYPHPEGTWPETEARLAENFSGLPEADLRKLLGENAMAWYGMSRDALKPIADRIGPTISLFE